MTTTTATITDFLEQRIAEDEAAARAASPGPWHVNAESSEVLAVDNLTVCDGFALSGPQLRATTAHIARHDPARVLAECAAHKSMVRRFQAAEDALAEPGIEDSTYFIRRSCRDSHALTLRALAAVHASHPEYRQEWAP